MLQINRFYSNTKVNLADYSVSSNTELFGCQSIRRPLDGSLRNAGAHPATMLFKTQLAMNDDNRKGVVSAQLVRYVSRLGHLPASFWRHND